jgi:hypothetical protein
MPRTLAQWTGIAVTAIVVSGSDMDLLFAVPLGIFAGALAIFFSSLAERAGQSHQLIMPLIGGARSLLAKIPDVRAVGACVMALFVGMWIGNFIETSRAIGRESAAVEKAVAEQAEDARAREEAAVSEALLQADNRTKQQLEKAADADAAADARARDAYKQELGAARRAGRAAVEKEQLMNEGLLSTNARLTEERNNLRDERDNLKDERDRLAHERGELAKDNERLRRVCGALCNGV